VITTTVQLPVYDNKRVQRQSHPLSEKQSHPSYHIKRCRSIKTCTPLLLLHS